MVGSHPRRTARSQNIRNQIGGHGAVDDLALRERNHVDPVSR
jgi:hypothetical protein